MTRRKTQMKKNWYLQTWLICLCFALWIFLIPIPIGIFLLYLKIQQEKNAQKLVQQLESSNKQYEKLLTPEMRDIIALQNEITNLSSQKDSLSDNIQKLELMLKNLNDQIDKKRENIISLDEEILVQEFGLYKPQYDFANSLDYNEELAKIRALQKELIKNKIAVTGNNHWQVNGSTTKGRKLVSDTQKLLLRAFNTECDDIISKVKYTNFDSSLNRIYKLSETISKLGTIMDISVTPAYLEAKTKELRLAFEYRQKKQEEKEEAKAAREEQREQAKLQREIEEQKKKVEKEQTHYLTAYEKAKKQLADKPDDKELLEKKAQLENRLEEIDKALIDIDYRQANMKAGYVYVISNIGAFGENIYKIGMTRRLNPQERIDELGDASVPFKFDVHAMIFSDDAPALENALHKAFENRKVNMVNKRREFFNVSLEEIKTVIRENFDKTVEFIDIPDAEQYRVSQRMRKNL